MEINLKIKYVNRNFEIFFIFKISQFKKKLKKFNQLLPHY